ncbi:MAG TPA: diguanylate cyclase [Gammaproteobacteria bacterium]|nr:diguanylate cyclase [Gammaproteobacteria bacterium]
MADRKPATPLCDQFGFDAEWREAQLTLIGLDSHSRDDVRMLHEKLLTREAAERIIDQFCSQLLKNRQVADLLSSFDLRHLKARQVDYFSEFGVRFRDARYFESRAQVGVAHARVGVPLSLYLESFGMLQCLILESLPGHIEDRSQRQTMMRLVLKLTTLDIALATEVYHRSRIQDLDRSVKSRRLEQNLLRTRLEQDALTGASSRTSLLRELQNAIARCEKTGQPLAVIMADLDHFKVVNDTEGHLVGDRVLAEVAARIKAALREFDLVGRYGGEEFVVLLENTSPHTAHQIAERIRQRIGSQPVHAAGQQVEITVSQGIGMWVEGDDRQSLLKRADEAMYAAKNAGRDCIVEV